MPHALITGVTGQDGSYLSEFLLEKGYRVSGLVRRSSVNNHERIRHLGKELKLVQGDLLDLSSLLHILEREQPDEIYNLAAQSFVEHSFHAPILTGQVTAFGALHVFEAARIMCPQARIYQASSSEMFGKVAEVPQLESTPFFPRSPYGVAKTFAHYSAINYRESYGMFISNGILFNHESPRRGEEFVTRKITRGVAKIFLKLDSEIVLGNLEAQRDWGFAGDYVEAMWKMLQEEEADDYVIGTGIAHSVRDFLDAAFAVIGIQDWSSYVRIDPALYRPAEVDIVVADPQKASRKLGWQPKCSFEELVAMMVQADIVSLAPQNLQQPHYSRVR